MSTFLSISPDQLEKRYSILPQSMVDALSADSTKISAESIATEYGITNRNEVLLFEYLISLVFMGFVHPDSLPEEISDFFELPRPKAEEITLKLKAQVFALYRADIEKVYVPPAPEMPKPAPLPAMASAATLNLKTAPASQPSGPAAPAIFPQPGVMPAVNLASRAPAGVGAPSAAPQPAPAPKPFVLHKESAPETVVASSGFRLNLEPKSFGSFPGKPAPQPSAPRAAKLELGQEVKKDAPKGFSMPTVPQKVVHYSDLKSSLGEIPSVASGLKAAPAPLPKAPAAPNAPVAAASRPLIQNAPGVLPQTPKAPVPAVPVSKTQNPASAPSPAAPKAPPKVVNFTADGGNAVK